MAYIDEKAISLSALSRNIGDIGVSRDRILDYLIEQDYMVDIRTVAPLGLEKGISYQYSESGSCWPVYDLNMQKMIFDHFNVNSIKPRYVKESIEKVDKKTSVEKSTNVVSIEFEELVEESVYDYYRTLSNFDRELLLTNTLKKYYGENATFRNGQLEAVEGVLLGKHALVVQKTGWGKSLVYFMATKMIREQSKRFTLIISPLLALMNNQIDSAKQLGMNICTLNSTNKDDWKQIINQIKNNRIDALIVSPERLANEEFKNYLANGLSSRIGLFVVDEAHCISDWGHDFRPDYRRIVNLIKMLPNDIPILATTATASARVVEDIKEQLGNEVHVSRGELLRESIAIQTIHIDSREERMAWLAKHINELPGTGVIYCLTVNDCNSVCEWLNANNIPSQVYTGRTDEKMKKKALDLFEKNKIKVLVATSAFGMGYDKPDIGFVVHFQKPKDVVSYYQQIGRAGRSIEKSFAILLYGKNDDIINQYFIDNAFPTEEEMNAVVKILTDEPGLEKKDIIRLVNMTKAKIDGVITYLEVEGAIYLEDKKYYIKSDLWQPDMEKSREITRRRYVELDIMNQFATTDKCYMQFLAKELDDDRSEVCGKCSNCIGKNLIDTIVDKKTHLNAAEFVDNEKIFFEPRKEWPLATCSDTGKKRIPPNLQLQQGKVLCSFDDSKKGKKIIKEKYEEGKFSDETIEDVLQALTAFVAENHIINVSFVPSLNYPDLVRNLALAIADKFQLVFYDALEKVDENEEGSLNNSYLQWQDANDYYEVIETREGNTLLIDDTFRSKWTLTVCGYKLLKMGNGSIYPFVLLETSTEYEQKHDLMR